MAYDPAMGGRLAVGSREADSSASVLLFDNRAGCSSWQLHQVLRAGDGPDGDCFGQSLAMDPIHGAWLFVGADPSALAGPENAGALDLFTRKKNQP